VRVLLRPYLDEDAVATLHVFRRAIRLLASADYTPEQLSAWASDEIDPEQWALARHTADTVIAEVDRRVAGFTDVTADGYIDMLFVDPDVARRGVASALLTWAAEHAAAGGATRLTTHASITARPFFERHGFTVDHRREPVLRGVTMVNYAMSRPVSRPAGPPAAAP
jgi:putative acetyltransferase